MNESKSANKKDDVYWKVLNCALELEVKKGHQKWTMTELGRKSKITRSLIYYYFGRSKMDILQAAVNIIGEEFIGLSNQRQELWNSEEFETGLLETRKMYDRMPYLCSFYLDNRDKDNDIGFALRKVDQAFKSKLKKAAPKASPEQINTLFAVYFGIAYSPFVGPAEVKIYVGFIRDIFAKLK